MKTNRNARERNLLYIIILFVFVLMIFLWSYQKQHWDSDIFWALKSGQWIVAHTAVPRVDIFSYTFANKGWIDFTWGFQVVAFLFFTYLGGWTGLFILQAGLTFLTFFFIYKNISLLTSSRAWLTLALLLLLFAAVRTRYIIRPQIFAYLFLALYFYILSLYMDGAGRRSYYIWLLLPLQVLWVNFHSSFILGIFMLGAYASGEFIEERFTMGLFSLPTRRTMLLMIVSLLLVAVSIINPYGIKLALFPLVHMGAGNADALRYISEWTPTRIKELLFYLYPFPLNFFAIKVIFYLTLCALFLNRTKIKVRDLIILAPVAYMATLHIRWLVIFAFFAVPIAASNLGSYLGRYGNIDARLRRLSTVLAVIITLLFIYDYAAFFDKTNTGLGPKGGYYPETTVAFMKENNLRGSIYNSYIIGGYLIYNYPELKVFIDGRTPTVYSPYHFWSSRVAGKKIKWKRLQEDHALDMALIGANEPFCDQLKTDPLWIPIHFDDSSVLFLKDTPANAAPIAKWGFKEVDPCDTAKEYSVHAEPEKLKIMRAELMRDGIMRKGSARAHWILGLVDTDIGSEGRLKEALSEFKIANENIYNPRVNYDIGMVLVKLSRYDEAISAFELAMDGDSTFSLPLYGLGAAYYYKADYANAYKRLKEYINIAGDESNDLAYEFAGFSAFHTHRYTSAVNYLKKATILNDAPKDLSRLYYYLASSLLEQGDSEQATFYYKEALKLRPEYRLVLEKLAGELGARGEAASASLIKSLISDNN